MQEFFIKKGSINPLLRMELINDGRYDFDKSLINNALQNSRVWFSMKDTETGILKVSKQAVEIVEANTEGCEEKYILQYRWKDRDVKKEGIYDGWFDIEFGSDLTDGDETEYPIGKLTVPIEDDLRIVIK